MPSSNGVYSLPPGYLAVTGSTIQASQHNPPLEDIAAALTLRLSRDGSAPMTAAIQLASGSVSLPGAVFAADASSGFYKTTNGIGVAVGGVKVGEFLAGGISGARFLGELIPYTCTVAPALTVIPVGQTLSRVTYAALWAQAQIEIAAGSLLYNNGDGSTTFGIVDMRGRVVAAVDPSVAILTSATMTPDGKTMGAKGGSQNHLVTLGEVPTGITSVNAAQPISVSPPSGAVPFTTASLTTPQQGAGSTFAALIAGSTSLTSTLTGNNVISVTSNNTGGSALALLQPTLACNYLLFAGA